MKLICVDFHVIQCVLEFSVVWFLYRIVLQIFGEPIDVRAFPTERSHIL
jgi:hypothetical protein